MHFTGSIFPENFPLNEAVKPEFVILLTGMPTLRVGSLTVHLGTEHLEGTLASLQAAADQLRLFIHERNLTADEQDALAGGVL